MSDLFMRLFRLSSYAPLPTWSGSWPALPATAHLSVLPAGATPPLGPAGR